MKSIPQIEPSFDEHEAMALHDYAQSGGWMTEFRKTREFEDQLSQFTGSTYCVATNSGTISLVIALLALGIGPDDEVIVPDYTMIATPNAAKLIGAEPVLTDIDADTLCMDISQVDAVITEKTKAIIHVSLNGRTNDLDALFSLCKARDIPLIEDAAQSLGSFYGDRHLGTIGDIGTLSFSPAKIISTGQGGLLMTDNEELAGKIALTKDFGRTEGGMDIHPHLGFNFKFTDLQAVVGLEQLKKLPARMKRKKEIYRQFNTKLGGIDDISFIKTDLEQTTPWFIDIYIQDRDKLQMHLKEHGIDSRPVYPAIHTQRIYEGTTGKFPVAQSYCDRGLWLPSSPTLQDEDISYISDRIQQFYEA